MIGRKLRPQVIDFWLNTVASSPIWFPRVRTTLLRLGGVSIGQSAMYFGQRFISGNRIVIGDGCTINFGCLFDSAAEIRLGDNVGVGPQASFVTSTHEIGPARKRWAELTPLPIVVEDGAWIGARAAIMPGVVIGRGAIVAAGALVRRDVEPNSVYGGVPARRIRDLT